MIKYLLIYSVLIIVYVSGDLTFETKNRLLKGVKSLVLEGAFGPIISLRGSNSISIITQNDNKYVVASELGLGNLIAFGHNGVFSDSIFNKANNSQFIANIFSFLSKNKTNINVLNYYNTLSSSYVNFLKSFGINVNLTQSKTLNVNLTEIDIIIIPYLGIYPKDVTEVTICKLTRFIKNGGGIFTGASGWVWLSYGEGTDSSKSIQSDFFNNRILEKFGLYFSDGGSGLQPINDIKPIDILADQIKINSFLKILAKKIENSESLSANELLLGEENLNLFVQSEWLTVQNILNEENFKYEDFLKSYGKSVKYMPNPNENKALTNKDETGNLLYKYLMSLNSKLSPQDVKPFPDAISWPGVALGSDKIERSYLIPPNRTHFITTGLWTNGGDLLKVKINNARYLKNKIQIRVGTGDDLLYKESKKRVRFPIVRYEFNMIESELYLSTPHGGMIYIFIGNPVDLQDNLTITISNGIPAPYFNIKYHKDSDWLINRNNPAPFFNIECNKLIFISPVTPFIKTELKNMEALCEWWDRLYLNYPFLTEDIRNYKEVIMSDIDIGGGYMHSGMPIMTFLDVVDFQLNKNDELFKKCSWGHFHEIGHNFQASDWTFSGTGEVTNNIFSLYGGYTMCGFKPLSNPWFGAGWIDKEIKKQLARNQTEKWGNWTDSPGLALIMYAQIAEEFSFDIFRKVFTEYKLLNKEERPKNDDEKRDQWLIRLSGQLNKNLGPFFEKWGVPVSETAKFAVSQFENWMPPNF